jgi:3-methyladenine DNA glycosylase AlkC
LNILNYEIKQTIDHDLTSLILEGNYVQLMQRISEVIDELYSNIPEEKRVSYGRVYTIKVLSNYLFAHLKDAGASLLKIASRIFKEGGDYRIKGVALGIISLHGLDDFESVLTYFESSAASSDWNMRELAQMFFRRLIKKHPENARRFLLRLVKSHDPNLRRFVAETLRPVRENRWFYKQPDYPLSILRHLFKEKSSYPRASVGNNLSDLARRLPDLVYGLVEELVDNGDENSYWIAYRACRNLVKKEPIKVMNQLRVDEYKYKNNTYKRTEYITQ